MKNIFLWFIGVLFLSSCKNPKAKPAEQAVKKETVPTVEIKTLLTDSISVRAIAIKKNTLFYAGNQGKFGYIDLKNPKKKVQFEIMRDSVFPEFRSIASTPKADFILSVANPALLYRVSPNEEPALVYTETDSTVFYDSMAFWNKDEGIAMGDPTDGCLSILITRDGGKSWEKISCKNLPKTAKGEAAFAASDSNIAIANEKTWLVSGGTKSRVYFSPDKGKTWSVFETPLVQGKPTTGGYSIDFYNEKIGVVFGGDYTQPKKNQRNKAITIDGGKTWKLLAPGKPPGYKSCVQFVPNANAKEIVAVGFTGISYSSDGGKTWDKISEEGFYTLRFLNDSVAFAAGKNRIARLVFNK